MHIEKEELLQRMKSDQTVVLNVLSKSDFKKLHIKGSENHPFTEDPDVFSKEVAEKYGKEKFFIVYCDHFGLLDSYMASRALEIKGLRVLNYSGGVREWHRAGLPVEGTDVIAKLAEIPAVNP